MGQPAKRRATYEDLRKVPDNLVAEIVDGELIATPRPASLHTRASSRLGGTLGGPFDIGAGGPGGWLILDEPELHLHADVLVPDLAGWRRERMPELPDVAAFEVPPDWVCEVASPKTAAVDRTRKMRIYGREGVTHVWILDPLVKTLEVYRREGDKYLLFAGWSGEEKVRAEPFDAIELDLALL